ncbi:MAG: hypothetical protein DI603_05830 [Roseateles depolymerans]|uniref:Uncharacterized protein n=1 Tax=Roseateles depolymerans TaxID=76731 RepID=A0A2W5FTV1_9BURK|nr:MAG: hypothetical protein DI603_05830 [Roseateles depolymerans]
MQLNLMDPDSILRWWRCFPERHWHYLEAFETGSPQFRFAIRQARRRIQADPLFNRARIDAFDAASRLQAATDDTGWDGEVADTATASAVAMH